MPDEVIVGAFQYGGGARAAAFSCRHMFCRKAVFCKKAVFCRKAVGPSFETHRLRDAPQNEVLETLMVRSAA
jgi:hypothetical protein